MKKSLILLSVCSAVLLTSCGTSAYYASSGFEDGIYYRASKDARDEIVADNEKVHRLIEQTKQEAARFSDTIIIASPDSRLELQYTPRTQYTIMFDDKLDSLGQVNLNFNFDDWYPGYGFGDYYSYWDWRYRDVFGPMWYRGWPGYGYWGWYDPWYGGWNFGFGITWDPWYGPWGRWYAGWYGPGWWGPGLWGWYDYWYDPWYWGYPVASFHPTYYGKRNTGVRSGGSAGGRQLAASTGSVRTGGRQGASVPSISTVRGRTASLSGGSRVQQAAVAGRTPSRTFHASGSNVNLGERYVSRSSTGAIGSRPAVSPTTGRNAAAYGSGRTFRRPAGTSVPEFRNPFESRTSVNSSFRNNGRRFDSSAAFNRQSGYNSRTTINRNNNSTVRSFSTGSSFSRSSSMGSRSYGGGGGSRSGGGGSVRR